MVVLKPLTRFATVAVAVPPTDTGLMVTTSVAVAATQGEDWPVVAKVSVTEPAVLSAVDGV